MGFAYIKGLDAADVMFWDTMAVSVFVARRYSFDNYLKHFQWCKEVRKIWLEHLKLAKKRRYVINN